MRTYAVDWDATLVDESGEWLPGARRALAALAAGGTVIVHSCRANWDSGAETIRAKLDAARLRNVKIWREPGKPQADCYVDNLAIRFDGDWPKTLRAIRASVSTTRKAA